MIVPDKIGLYIHVPFCLSKCPYCDFYSLPLPGEEALDAYTEAVLVALDSWAEQLGRPEADTLYFGGGTPSLLGGGRLARIIGRAAARFGLAGAEITLEANPGDDLLPVFQAFAGAGGNRVSLGMQAAEDEALLRLGRRHRTEQVEKAAGDARAAGLDNLSLDLMLATEGQTSASIARAVAFCRRLNARHVSAYLLKIEENTPFARERARLRLPGEEESAGLYEYACEALEGAGFQQYEISNFAQTGWESRHNRKYWESAPYLGIGPAAHSCLNGRRFAYPRDLAAFLAGSPPTEEPASLLDAREEYAMLRLRLTEGLLESAYRARFGEPLPPAWRRRAENLLRLTPRPLLVCDKDGIRLTRAGFLLSNSVIGHILGP